MSTFTIHDTDHGVRYDVSDHGVTPKPITPFEMDSLRGLAEASEAAEAAYGTPAFTALSLRYHVLAKEHMAHFGADVRPPVTVGTTTLPCGHPLTRSLETPECTTGCWQ